MRLRLMPTLGAIAMLASEEVGYVTGQIVGVTDDGFMRRVCRPEREYRGEAT